MSSRRSNLVLVLLIVLALGGVALLVVPGSPLHRGGKKGLASLCIGGGEATARAVELA